MGAGGLHHGLSSSSTLISIIDRVLLNSVLTLHPFPFHRLFKKVLDTTSAKGA
jgi:hypothetical protein